ncbi:MAG: glycosyltransferase [Chloroflexota bacterium]
MISKGSILFVATSSNATSGGGRTRIVDVAIETKKRGFSPAILCFVYATQWLSGPLFLMRGRESLSDDAGCPVVYLPLLPFGRLGLVNWLNGWLAGLLLAILAWLFQIRLLFGHGTKAGYFGLRARQIRPGIKVVSDIQGSIVDEYLYEHDVHGSDAASQRMETEESMTLATSDALTFVSHSMRHYYENRFRRSFSSAVIIPCGTLAGFVPDALRRQTQRRTHGLENKFVVCYVGAAETYQLPEVMCRLFKNIYSSMPNAFFLIYSYQVAVFEKCLRAQGISSDYYKITSASHDQIFDQLQMGDIGLLLRDKSPVNLVASPLKFAEYCLCGLPVITTPHVGDFSAMVIEHHIGYWVDIALPISQPGLLEFLQDVGSNRAEYALRCTEFARNHLSWDVHGPVLVDLFHSLLDK